MSDDLISRKALIEEIQNFRCTITGLRAGKGVLARAADEYRKSILQIVDDQPTAFDKEKVLEELKNATGDIHFTEDGSFNGKIIEDFDFIQAKTVIEIIEKGGIE